MKRGAYKPSISGTNAKLLSAALGCVLLVIAIFLENNFPKDAKVAQIVVWTLIAVSVPVLANYTYIRRLWFWKSILMGSIVHSVIVISFLPSMPFSSMGIVMLFAFPETILWMVIFLRFAA